MNTAISVTGTGAWEDVTSRTAPDPRTPGNTGMRRPGGGESPVRLPHPGRTSRPCAAIARPGSGSRAPAALRIGPAVRGRAVAPEPAELVQRARAGFAATAVTALLTAVVVAGFLALAHLRAPEPPPAPELPGIPAVAVPAAPGGAAGVR
ncbi:hypothetical protein [Nocardia flavorosea]|uniref:hypothetical protein n=1 Tax=Nocardia flavorosea TaxID=53429 RepID=UPI0024566091|nr:hypothetical protein [Nocardia flavorosea]